MSRQLSSQLKKFDYRDFEKQLDLGSGGYGEVQLLRHKNTKELLVGKFFHFGGSQSMLEYQVANVKRETKILAQIRHKNIVRICGNVVTSNSFGIIMEYVSCGNLDGLLHCDRCVSLPWKIRARFFVELAEALNYLHYHDPRRSYVHGDMKPENVLLSDSLAIKLGDFGAASISMITGSTTLAITSDTNVQYTPLYVAPEFLNNPTMRKRVRMDVYSYGLIGYEILTRHRVYANRNVPFSLLITMVKDLGQKPDISILNEVARTLISTGSTTENQIFSTLEEIVKQCWQTEPSGRPTICEVKDSLDRLALSENIFGETTDREAKDLVALRKLKPLLLEQKKAGYLQIVYELFLSFPRKLLRVFASENQVTDHLTEENISITNSSNSQGSTSVHQLLTFLHGKLEEVSILQNQVPVPELPHTSTEASKDSTSSEEWYSCNSLVDLDQDKLNGNPQGNDLAAVLEMSDDNPNSLADSHSEEAGQGGQELSQRIKRGAADFPSQFISSDLITIDISRQGFLGSGGYGKVRIGFTDGYGIVAVKAIELAGDPKEIDDKAAQIEKEIRLLHHSNHPNVVRMYGCSIFPDSIAVVMEYMPGKSLHHILISRCNDSFAIPYALRLRFCLDISRGVAFLHHNFGDERIVHGDIKPANILLTKDLDCKVADFGGAQIATISDDISKPRPKEKGCQMTKGYIAPERRCSEVGLSKAMDVYSVGATFSAILRRKSPSKVQMEFEKQLETCCCPLVISKEEIGHFEFLKQHMLNCCAADDVSRSRILDVKNSLEEHWRKSADCDAALITNHVAKILEIYKVDLPSSDFSKRKLLSDMTSKDFAYKARERQVPRN